METRLVIAYLLIAIMVALAIFGAIRLWQKNKQTKQRDNGNGAHMRNGSNADDET